MVANEPANDVRGQHLSSGRKVIKMNIYRWQLDSEQLKQMPDKDRALFFMLGHVSNEINVLNKLFYLSNQYDHSERYQQHAHITQGMVIARTLIGKLWESWGLLKSAYYGAKLSACYDTSLSDEAREALKSLGRCFGRNSFIAQIRNSFAFHYSVDEIRKILSGDLSPEELINYMAGSNGNTVYYASEYVTNVAILQAVEKGDPQAAMERLIDISVEVVGLFNTAAQGIMLVATERYLSRSDGSVPFELVEIDNVPIAESLEIPFFFESQPTQPKE